MGIKTGAVVLAAGRGKRMKTETAKQFLELKGKPLLFYSLNAFEQSCVDEVILVTGQNEIAYCQEKIIQPFGFSKVKAVVAGGEERVHSVYQGLTALAQQSNPDYVLIHDGARPLVTEEIIRRALEGAVHYQSCVVGMPVKDTIKISNREGYAQETPDRRYLWQVQTPQAFSFALVYTAYQKVMQRKEGTEGITDDAMVVEWAEGKRVKLVEGSYQNLKVTTPEDLVIAEALLEKYTLPGTRELMSLRDGTDFVR